LHGFEINALFGIGTLVFGKVYTDLHTILNTATIKCLE
jgi:hypothetical protein